MKTESFRDRTVDCWLPAGDLRVGVGRPSNLLIVFSMFKDLSGLILGRPLNPVSLLPSIFVSEFGRRSSSNETIDLVEFFVIPIDACSSLSNISKSTVLISLVLDKSPSVFPDLQGLVLGGGGACLVGQGGLGDLFNASATTCRLGLGGTGVTRIGCITCKKRKEGQGKRCLEIKVNSKR
ncbi:hypothetical protein V1477_010464 [Vespula maculifrons]|uniref:Uncharacterized protein n=1 Tax=Vespula maculifrons TaxID=7453 RepID=A0ABD2C8Q7_VESMC